MNKTRNERYNTAVALRKNGYYQRTGGKRWRVFWSYFGDVEFIFLRDSAYRKALYKLDTDEFILITQEQFKAFWDGYQQARKERESREEQEAQKDAQANIKTMED